MTVVTVPTLTLYRAIGTGERSAEDIRQHLRDAPDLAGLSAELDGLVRHGELRSRTPARGPTVYAVPVPLVLPGGVDRLAAAIDGDRRRLELAALAAVAGVLSRVGTHARSAYRMGRDPGADVVTTLAGGGNVTGIGPRLASVATAANYAARQRTAREARSGGVDPAVLAGLLTLGRTAESALAAGYEQQAQGYVDSLARRAAVAVRDAVGGRDATEASIGAALATSGVAGQTRANPAGPWAVRQLAVLLIGLGYADGQGAVLGHPEVARDLSALTYHTRGDGRVRPLHARLHGMTRPPADPVWQRVTPPRWSHDGMPQWGCRCWRVPRFGAVQMTLVPPGV